MPLEAQPAVTVVIPTRNRLPLLQEAVASVRVQRYPRWSLTVVDDASTDGTAAWLASLADRRVSVVRCQEGVERSVARNLGLAGVRSPYVLFLDDDDLLRPNALSSLVRGAAGHPEAFAAVGARALFDEVGHRRRMSWPRWTICHQVWPEVLAGWVAVAGQTLFRTDRLREGGGWREGMNVAEDQDLWLRLGYGRPAVIVPQTVVGYRLHGISRTPADTRILERRLRDEFVGKVAPRDKRRANQAIAAWRMIIASNRFFCEHDHRQAATLLLDAARTAPWLFVSPLTGPGLVISLSKYLVAGALPGGAGMALERGVHRAREAVGLLPRSRADEPDAALTFWAMPFEDSVEPSRRLDLGSEAQGAVPD